MTLWLIFNLILISEYISNDAFYFSDTFFDLFQEKYKKSKKSGLTEVMSQTYISQTHEAVGVKYKYEISTVNG